MSFLLWLWVPVSKRLLNVLFQGNEEQEDYVDENIYEYNHGLKVKDSLESDSQAPKSYIFKCLADNISSGSVSGPEIHPSLAALADS